jgi:hypothetical protein
MSRDELMSSANQMRGYLSLARSLDMQDMQAMQAMQGLRRRLKMPKL